MHLFALRGRCWSSEEVGYGPQSRFYDNIISGSGMNEIKNPQIEKPIIWMGNKEN